MPAPPPVKSRTFKVSLRNYWLAAIPMGAVAGLLIYRGYTEVHRLTKAAPTIDISLTAPLYAEIGLGILLLMVVLAVLPLNVNRSVTITPDRVTCMTGKQEFVTAWRDVIAVFPTRGQTRFRHILISDSAGQSFRIEEFFYPEFRLLLDVTREAVESHRSANAEYRT